MAILRNFFKMAHCRVQYRLALRRIRRLQAIFRSRKYRKSFKETKRKIIRLQAMFRKHVTFTQQTKRRAASLKQLRSLIVLLWGIEHTPLLYRSRFWILFDAPSYLNIGIHEDELQRLQTVLGFDKTTSASASASGSGSASASTPSQRRRGENLTRVVSARVLANQLTVVNPDIKKVIAEAAKAEAEERKRLYTAFKMDMSDAHLHVLFAAFAIDANKKRKQTLSTIVWLDPDKAATSSCAVVAANNFKHVATSVRVPQRDAAGAVNGAVYVTAEDMEWMRSHRMRHIEANMLCIARGGLQSLSRLSTQLRERNEQVRVLTDVVSASRLRSCKSYKCCLHGRQRFSKRKSESFSVRPRRQSSIVAVPSTPTSEARPIWM